jgi:hypothetical protein
MASTDEYDFKAYCEECGQERSGAASRLQIRTGDLVKVYGPACGHSWTLGPEDSKTMREQIGEVS